MKKVLLFIAASTFAMAGMSQQIQRVNRSQVEKLPQLMRKAQVETGVTGKLAMRKTKATNIYYTTPAGTFWGDFDPVDGGGFYHSTLIVPPYTDLTFTNRSTKADTWTLNGNAVDAEDVVDGNYVTFSYRQYGSYATYGPTVGDVKNDYTFGELNWIEKRGYMTTAWVKGLIRTDSLTGLWPSDPRYAVEYQGSWYSPVNSWGALDSDNLYGTGNLVGDDYSYKAAGVLQYFAKPISPLFITSAYVDGVTPLATTAVIPEGKQLRMVLARLKQVTEDGETYTTYDLDNVIATMYCNAGDTIGFSENDAAGTRNGKELKSGTLVFQVPGEEDEIGNIVPQNIVVDEPFAMLILGLEQDGVDVGFQGLDIPEEDVNCREARLLVLLDNGSLGGFGYNSPMSLNFCFYGMFDKVATVEEVPMYNFEVDELDYNVVSVPVDGGTAEDWGNMTYGATGSPLTSDEEGLTGYPGLPVMTNVGWFDDENEVTNYDVIDLPDWIENYSVYDGMYDEAGGLNIVMFKAQALPEGVSERRATVRVVGQEVTMDGQVKYSAESLPITIIQTRAAYDGIQNTVAERRADNTIFSLSGQKIGNAYKGVILQNGKKFVRK
ncbi:MAG: hypothetical protein IJ612_06630 [Prevotella sp.]|nr:hypothetical protein [Prevotella sp.]